MPGLFGTLAATSQALSAQSYALDVTGQNIANVNTPGYTRRQVLLSSTAAPDPFTQGAGVQIDGVQGIRDRLLERRLQMEQPAAAREGAIADSLSVVEVAIGQPGQSIDAQMDAFFTSASQLASDPSASTARQSFVLAGQNLASSFRDMYTQLTDASQAADTQVRGAVSQINALATQLATINGQLAQAPANGTQSLSLQDHQKELLDQLTQLVDVSTVERADGGVDISVGSGRPLVVGTDTMSLDTAQQPPNGYVALTSQGVDVTNEITGGSLAGYLQVRDSFVPDYQTKLDAMAAQVQTSVNAIHTGGFDNNANAGEDFFTVDPNTSAAASIQVNPDIVADPNLVAAAGVQANGDNQAARDMAALRDAQVMDNGRSTLSDMWGQLTYTVGNDTQVAKNEQTSRQAIVTQVQALADSVSGVSMDEEAMSMLKYQRAYEANAQFFTAVNNTITSLMAMVTTAA